MFGNIYGLDLGTYESKYLIKSRIRFVGRETLLQLKIKKVFLAIGDKAYEMYEKAPE